MRTVVVGLFVARCCGSFDPLFSATCKRFEKKFKKAVVANDS
jgi:hypothetical protein